MEDSRPRILCWSRAFAVRGALALAAATLVSPAPVRAAGVDETCALSLTRVDDQDVNVLLPDSAARYWIGAYPAVPGLRVRIQGNFPHARYMSLSIYDPAGRPISSLSDRQITPDPGSSNPFLPGADRTALARGYTAFIAPGSPPSVPAANTLYGGENQAGQPNAGGLFVYRVYLPDAGTDDLGGVGLPAVTVQTSDGSPVSAADCRNLQRPPTGLPANDLVKGVSPPPAIDASPCPGADPPIWRRNVNVAYSYWDGLFENSCGQTVHDAGGGLPLGELGHGGLYGNRDADYLIAPINRGHGQVLVIRGRAPTFPDTRGGATVMPGGTDVRYYSFCQYSPFTTRVVDCLADDQIPVDSDGDYTIAVSTLAARPEQARADCGVAWLDWGPEPDGVLLMREMLPDPAFAFAIQRVPAPGDESATLGAYYPRGEYLPGPAAFDAAIHPCARSG